MLLNSISPVAIKLVTSGLLWFVQAVSPDELTMLHFLFIVIALLGLYLGCYLIAYKKGHNIFMGIFVLALASILLELTLLWWDGEIHIPRIPFMASLLFLLGPSLHLYLERKIYPQRKVRKSKEFLYFSIFFLSFFLLFLVANSEINLPFAGFRDQVARLLNNSLLKTLYASFFLALMVHSFFRYHRQLERLDRKWAFLLISFFAAVFLLSLARTLFSSKFVLDHVEKYAMAYLFSVFILGIALVLHLLPDLVTRTLFRRIDSLKPREKYQNSGLTPAMALTLKEQLLASMEQKTYLDPALSLEGLARKLNTDRYSLSQVINQEFNINFYEFINDYRIQECMALIQKSPNPPDSVSELIYNSGFNNKVSFYKAFKKRNQVTPAQYIKALFVD